LPETWRRLVAGETFGLYEGRTRTATISVLEDWNVIGFMILVAGPYRSGTDGDPARIQANVDAMTRTSLALWKLGHLPVMGEWFALPLIGAAEAAGDTDADTAIFHPIAEAVLSRCDGVLRIGGPSEGADRMVATAERLGKSVWHSLDEVPAP